MVAYIVYKRRAAFMFYNSSVVTSLYYQMYESHLKMKNYTD